MKRSWGSSLELTTVGITLVLATLLGYVGGAWLDHKLGTEPVLGAIGLLLGAAGGFVQLFRVVGASSRTNGGDDGEG
jgi:F0F1-type ATP synthase assembly protein I